MVTIIAWILLTIVVFGFIVFIHELWHFSTAKFFGVKVEEFGMWLPPRMIKLWKDKKWTIYSLNWLPIGWFVNLKWEQYDELIKIEDDFLISKKTWQQMIIILAWVFMNFLLAIIILSVLFFTWTQPLAINNKFQTNTKTLLIPNFEDAIEKGIFKVDWLYLEPLKWSIAEKSGIQKDDVLLSVDNKKILKPEEFTSIIKNSKYVINLEIKRKDKISYIQILPKDGKIGTYIWYNIIGKNKDFVYKFGFFESIWKSVIEVKNQSFLVFELFEGLLKKIFTPVSQTERTEAIKSVGWPIALGNFFVTLASEKVDFEVIILIWVLLSINLWVFNLLPFPALDGWRFFILAINWITGIFFKKKVVDYKWENLIHLIGFAFLILVSILIAYNDIFNIIKR